MSYLLAGGGIISYAKFKDSALDNGYTIINGADSGVIIVRPLTGWTEGRQVTLQFTDLDPAVTGTLSGYKSENIGSTNSSASLSDGKITIDFGAINSDSVQLTLANTEAGGETRHYKIKLLSGMRVNPKLIMDGTKTSDNAYARSSGSANIDKEWKIAVSEEYVYVLIMNRTTGSAGSIAFGDILQSTYDLYAYRISGGKDADTKNSPTTATYKMNTGSKKIIDIACIDNILYGISLETTETTGNNGQYMIHKWSTTDTTTAPSQISLASNNTLNNSRPILFTANKEGTDIAFYSISTVGGSFANPIAVRISTALDGSGSGNEASISAKQLWGTNGLSTGSYGYTSFVNIPNSTTPDKGRAILTSSANNSGYILGGRDYSGNGININNYGFTNRIIGTASPEFLVPGGVEIIRDKYYFIHNGVMAISNALDQAQSNKMYIIDFGKNIGDTMTSIGATGTNVPGIEMYKRTRYSESMNSGSSLSASTSSRGNCRVYKMSNGKVRIASLMSSMGFKVWDMQ